MALTRVSLPSRRSAGQRTLRLLLPALLAACAQAPDGVELTDYLGFDAQVMGDPARSTPA